MSDGRRIHVLSRRIDLETDIASNVVPGIGATQGMIVATTQWRSSPMRIIALAVLALMGLAGCVTPEAGPPSGGGPRYMQEDNWRPTRQTDLFGNGLRP